MTDVFISYSRKDIAFARLLHEALAENELETWIDWQDIPPSADWLAEVYEAIEGADAFVFVISETSLNSEICGLEINHAAQHNKRLIPIVIKDVEAEQVPKELAVLNWIFFEEAGEKFAEAMEDLVTAITVDQDWVKGHTRFENRALAWEKKENDRVDLYLQIEEAFFGREGTFPIAPLFTPIRHFAIVDWLNLVRDSNFWGVNFSKSRIDMEAKEAARGE